MTILSSVLCVLHTFGHVSCSIEECTREWEMNSVGAAAEKGWVGTLAAARVAEVKLKNSWGE